MSIYRQSTRSSLWPCTRVFSTTTITHARQARPRFGIKRQPLSDSLDITSPLLSFDAFQDALTQNDSEGFGLRRDVRAERAKAFSGAEGRMWGAVLEGRDDGTGKHRRKGRGSFARRTAENVQEMGLFPSDSWSASRRFDELQDDSKDVTLEEPAYFQGHEAATVYVGNVPQRISEDALKELLEEEGEIEDVKFPDESVGEFWDGYCEIKFKSPRSARNLATQQVYTKRNISLFIRSSRYGPGEKPIYLGEAGSVIFVDGLPRDTTQQQVRDVFQRFAPVEYVYIPRTVNGDTLRHGYVHFFETGIFNPILQSLKYTPLKLRGRLLTIEERDSYSAPRIPTRALFLGNIHKDITREAVVSLFKGLTPIDVSHVSCPGQPPGKEPNLLGSTAFVVFESTSEAQNILDMHHFVPFKFKGHEIKMAFCDPPVSSAHRVAPHSTLYMAGFGSEVEAGDIRDAFKSFESHIKAVRIRRDPVTGRSKRTAFLQMATTEAAQRVLEHHRAHPTRIGDSGISLQYAKAHDEEQPTRDLRLTEFGPNRDVVKPYFNDHKQHITRFSFVWTKSEGQSAYIRFSDILYSMQAKQQLEGKPMSNGFIPLIKFGTSKRPGINLLNAPNRLVPQSKVIDTNVEPSAAEVGTQNLTAEIPPTDRLLDENAQKSKVPQLEVDMAEVARKSFLHPPKKKR